MRQLSRNQVRVEHPLIKNQVLSAAQARWLSCEVAVDNRPIS